MKTLLIFATLVVSSLALTDSQKEKLREIGKTCKQESGLTDEIRDKLKAGELPDDPNLKKHILCVWKKLGLVNADGEIVEDKIHERVKAAAGSEEEAEKICEKCKEEHKNTHEETVFAVNKCLLKKLPNFSPVE